MHSGEKFDVVVVGGGNAGFSAAYAAADRGRRVLLLEKGELGESGGNSYYTAGAFRIAHNDRDELTDLLDGDGRHTTSILDPYTAQKFTTDMTKAVRGQSDPALTETLVEDSQATLRWSHGKGPRFRLTYERQAYPDDRGRQIFWGGLAVGSTGGGNGLIDQHTQAAQQAGVEIRYGVRAQQLMLDDGAGVGLEWTDSADMTGVLRANSVVLAAGGFEAAPELRAAHLGERWRRTKMRGTPHNTGDMLIAAIHAGAATYGDWDTCHSVAWDAWHPGNESNRDFTNQLTRGGYPLGIAVNSRGERFLDEDADFRDLTYAKYGVEILQQPDGVASQRFDATPARGCAPRNTTCRTRRSSWPTRWKNSQRRHVRTRPGGKTRLPTPTPRSTDRPRWTSRPSTGGRRAWPRRSRTGRFRWNPRRTTASR